GHDMPPVPEEQTLFVRARSGTYVVSAGSSTATLDYSWNATQVESELETLFGTQNLSVAMTRSTVDVLYRITFLREDAARGWPLLTLVSDTGLTPNPDASVLVQTARIQTGTTTPSRTVVQTLTV